MHPATLHGVVVITKLYFAILAVFNETITLNLDQMSSKVIDFCSNRKRIYIFPLMVNSNVDPILHRFRDTAALMLETANFPYPTPIAAKIKKMGMFLLA